MKVTSWISALCSLAFGFSVLAVANPTAWATDYWPLTDGAEYIYESASGEEINTLVETSFNGSIWWRMYGHPYATDGLSILFSGDESKDVIAIHAETYGWSSFGGQWFFEIYDCGFPEEGLFLDLPLEEGASWVWMDDMLMIFSVGGEETVNTPLGSFEAMVFTITVYHSPCNLPTMTLYLARNVGPVRIGDYVLTAASGVVTNETMSFSEIKRLYH